MKIKVWLGIALASLVVCGGVFLFGGLAKSTLASTDPFDPMAAQKVAATDPFDPMSGASQATQNNQQDSMLQTQA